MNDRLGHANHRKEYGMHNISTLCFFQLDQQISSLKMRLSESQEKERKHDLEVS